MKLASVASVALVLPGLVDVQSSIEVNDQHLIAHAELEARRDLFDVAVWNSEMQRQWLEAVEPEPADTEPRAATPSTGRCGSDLPDCSIMECESGGSLTAQNPNSSASGKWQFIDSTWNNFGGYPTAADAPEEVQDQKARELWRGGAGRGHWQQCL